MWEIASKKLIRSHCYGDNESTAKEALICMVLQQDLAISAKIQMELDALAHPWGDY